MFAVGKIANSPEHLLLSTKMSFEANYKSHACSYTSLFAFSKFNGDQVHLDLVFLEEIRIQIFDKKLNSNFFCNT